MPSNPTPSARHRSLIPPATLDALRARLDTFRHSLPTNPPPLTPAQRQAELDLLAPVKPARQPAFHNVPECSTPAAGAKRTHHTPPPAMPADRENVPQSSTPPRTSIFAKRTHRPARDLTPVPSSLDLTPRQERAARLLAVGHTAVAAAALLGVERHTIQRYKRLPAFNDHLRRLLASL